MNVILFAMESAFARAALARLLATPGIRLAALVEPARAPAGFPAIRSGDDSNAAAARAAGAAVIPHHDDDALVERLAPMSADLAVVACYPRRIGAGLAALPTLACVNLHPSLLPAYRGPDPLFWQLKAGERHTGVSVHRVEPRLDAGNILARRAVSLPRGGDRATLERLLGDAAASLLAGHATSCGTWRFSAQDDTRATSQPMPTAADRVVHTDWFLERAYDFLCGAAAPGTLFRVTDGRHTVAIREILGRQGDGGRGIVVHGDGTVSAGFAGGVILARTAQPGSALNAGNRA